MSLKPTEANNQMEQKLSNCPKCSCPLNHQWRYESFCIQCGWADYFGWDANPNRPAFSKDAIATVRSGFTTLKAIPDDEVHLIADLWRAGTDINTIAEKTGRHRGTIYKVIRERIRLQPKGSPANTNQ